MKMPVEAAHLLETLARRGHTAYLVGGCVRDSLLGRAPTDWDIATDATPAQVISCFRGHSVLETGLKHGTVTVLVNRRPFEITTFRVDGEYLDNRRPESVRFTSRVEEDLSRRDFTVNAMAWNPSAGLVDPFHGEIDLTRRRVACMGDPAKRFGEDALRIFRAVRFASTLDFSVDPATAAAMEALAPSLRKIAAERVRVELDKALVGPAVANAFKHHPAVVTAVIPELELSIDFDQRSRYHHLDVWRHTLLAVDSIAPDPLLRLTMLLHDIAKPLCCTEEDGHCHYYGHETKGAELAGQIARRLRYPTQTCQRLETLVLHHDADLDLTPSTKSIKRFLAKVGEEAFHQLLQVMRADALAHAPWCVTDNLTHLNQIGRVFETILAENQCFSRKDLAVNGHDLLAMGIPPGRGVGRMLDQLLHQVLEESLPNQRDRLLEAAAALLSIESVDKQ